MKPVNLEPLTKWATAIPDDVKKEMQSIAPMLSRLGYDPNAYPPNYGQADPKVKDNTDHIRLNPEYWKKQIEELHQMDKSKTQIRVIAGNSTSTNKDMKGKGVR